MMRSAYCSLPTISRPRPIKKRWGWRETSLAYHYRGFEQASRWISAIRASTPAGNEMKADAAGADEASTLAERMRTSKR